MMSSLVVILCFQPQRLPVSTADAQNKSKDTTPEIILQWKRSVGAPVSIASSPDGRFTAVVGEDGLLQCFGEEGQLVWQTSLPGVDRVVPGPDAYAVAYSSLNPLDKNAYLILPDGEVIWKHEVTGAVWCAAASNDTGVFAIGTGDGYCYLYSISARRHHYRRWRLPGVPCSLSFRPSGDSIVFGTWQDAGVAEYSTKGQKIHWRPGRTDRLHYVELCNKEDYVVVIAKPNQDTPEGAVYLKNSELNDLWSKEFSGYNLAASPTPSGDRIAVGFQKLIQHKDEEVRESRIALYDKMGRMLWEKGGVFGDWSLIRVCASGNLLVYDDSPHIYVLNKSGKVLLRRKLPATIRSFAAASYTDKVAIMCGDGQLCLFSLK